MTDHADRCATCGLSQDGFDEAIEGLFERYEAITRDAVLAERERLLGLFAIEAAPFEFGDPCATAVLDAVRRIREDGAQ